jgi:hypothetical protein
MGYFFPVPRLSICPSLRVSVCCYMSFNSDNLVFYLYLQWYVYDIQTALPPAWTTILFLCDVGTNKPNPYHQHNSLVFNIFNITGQLSVSRVRYNIRIYHTLCLSVRALFFVLAFLHPEPRSLTIFLRLEHLSLKSTLSLGLIRNLAPIGAVPSCLVKLWTACWTTHSPKLSISVIHLGRFYFLPGIQMKCLAPIFFSLFKNSSNDPFRHFRSVCNILLQFCIPLHYTGKVILPSFLVPLNKNSMALVRNQATAACQRS